MKRQDKAPSQAAKENGSRPMKLMRDALLQPLQREAKKSKPTKRLQFVADALVNAAIKGDVAAAKEIFDRIDGKVPQAATGEDGVTTVRLTLSAA